MNYIIVIVISYLLGNLSFAYILGKLIMKKDVRDYGSGSSGATNAIRVFGAKIGVLVFIGDVLKGVVAVLIGKTIGGEIGGYLAGAFVIIGHNWPALLNFKNNLTHKNFLCVRGMCELLIWITLDNFRCLTYQLQIETESLFIHYRALF